MRPLLLGVLICALAAPVASAHVERTSYWPDPAADTSISPAAGGAVPKIRSLASALTRKARKGTLVVCQPDSLKRTRAAIAQARKHGYRVRPMEALRHVSKRAAKRLLALNKRLFKRCHLHEVQPALTAVRNNGRVVVMPGLYTEPTARAIPSLPPDCDKYRITSEKGTGAVSYAFQFHCPNAQNLTALIGRALGPGQDPPSSPSSRPDPHGIPNEGACIRCNVQIEGSGPTPDDVILDAGRVESGNGGPLDSKKDITLKLDRADGAVVRNMTFRHAGEHDIYVLETDGYEMDRVKFFYAREYGTLMFTSDHGVLQDCDAVGNGDSGVYPGGAPDTGTHRDTHFYPEQRLNDVITRCDSHHNNLGYSGTMGNATHIYNNNFYDNAAGIATDSFYAGGHPGFPQDSAAFEGNRIFSNNFNIYDKNSGIVSTVFVPLGVGILIAGGDDNLVRNNYIYDNWRRGTMLIAVPDAVSCTDTGSGDVKCIPPSPVSSTSFGNRYQGNVMGRAPDGTEMPNGVDFWWDEFPGNTGNCWYPNTGVDGTPASITGDPAPPSTPGTTFPGSLPEDCSAPAQTSAGKGNAAKEAMLVSCAGAVDGSDAYCEWSQPPAKPGTKAAAREQAHELEMSRMLIGKVALQRSCTLLGATNGGTLTCSPFQKRV